MNTKLQQVKNVWNAHEWRAVQWWAWPLAWGLATFSCIGCLCGMHDPEQFATGRKCLLCDKDLE